MYSTLDSEVEDTSHSSHLFFPDVTKVDVYFFRISPSICHKGNHTKNPRPPQISVSRDPRPASFGSTLTCRSWAPPKIRHPKKKEPSSQVAWKIHGPWNLCHHSLHLISSSQQLVVVPLNFCGTFAHPRSHKFLVVACGCITPNQSLAQIHYCSFY